MKASEKGITEKLDIVTSQNFSSSIKLSAPVPNAYAIPEINLEENYSLMNKDLLKKSGQKLKNYLQYEILNFIH